jgi:RNA polymerase sigma-70 factor (ECF subfamily)
MLHVPSERFEDDSRPSLSLVGSSQSFRSKLVANVPRLRRRALALCRNGEQADELVQETIVRALRFESTYREDANFAAWASRVLYSIFITGCRVRSRETRALGLLAHDPNGWYREPRTPSEVSLTPAMEEKLEAVPERFREVLRLVDLEDASYREAADRVGVPVGTVMSRLFRGRRMLRELIGGELEAA